MTKPTCRAKSPTRLKPRAIGRANRSCRRSDDRCFPPGAAMSGLGRRQSLAAVLIEAAHFALALALGLSLVQFVVPLWGARTGDLSLMRVGSTVALTVFACVAFFFFSLIWGFSQLAFFSCDVGV